MNIDDVAHHLWMRALRITGRALLHGGYRLRVAGTEHVPTAGPALLVSNHVAFHDFLFVGVALGRPVRFVMHQHHFQYPLLRAFFAASRVIPIAPAKQDPQRLAAAMDAIDAALAAGELVVIFPEGRMTDDGSLSVLRPGLERIVARRPVPVIPVAVTGLFGSWMSRAHGEPMSTPPRRFRAPVEVRFGDPVPPAQATVEVLGRQMARMISAENAMSAEELAST